MDNNLDTTCGCGKPVRYSTFCGRGSCNKYMRCPSYEELEEEMRNLRSILPIYQRVLEKIMNTDAKAFEYRCWAKEAISHRKDTAKNHAVSLTEVVHGDS